MIILLKALSDVLQDSLNRCEHCGKEGNVFECEDCTRNKIEFIERMVDLLILLEPNEYKRMLAVIQVSAPLLASSPKSE